MPWPMPVLWLIAVVLLGILEAITTQLVTIWFALGALAALIAASFHAPLWLQFSLFSVVSVVTLVLTRPLVRKHLNGKRVPTNADRVIGRIGIVQQKICNTSAEGSVSVDGTVWTARSSDGSDIDSGTEVIADRIEGVKLFVHKKSE